MIEFFIKSPARYAALWTVLFGASVIWHLLTPAARAEASKPCSAPGEVTGDYHAKRAALLRQLVVLQEQIIELDRAQVGMQHFGNEFKH